MPVDKKSLLEEGHRLLELHRSYDDAELNEPFIVRIKPSLITIGLIADNTAVVIGAMVVAPWIMPLRTTVFAILIGDWRFCKTSHLAGRRPITALSMLIGVWPTNAALSMLHPVSSPTRSPAEHNQLCLISSPPVAGALRPTPS